MRFLFDNHVLDIGQRELRRGTESVALEPLVFDLLAYLVANRDHVVSKNDLQEAVWSGRIVSESAVASSVAAARRAIGDSGEVQKAIRTITRKGFRFVGEVLVDDGASRANRFCPGARRSKASPGHTPVSPCHSRRRTGLQSRCWRSRI